MQKIIFTTAKELRQLLYEVLVEKNSKSENSQTYLSNGELISILNVSSRTLQRWRDKGLIKFSQVGRKIYYKNKDIDEFLESNKGL